MRKYNIKLNPLKCAFGININKFIGFLVTQRGIEMNSNQVKVVLETLVMFTKKEMHSN